MKLTNSALSLPLELRLIDFQRKKKVKKRKKGKKRIPYQIIKAFRWNLPWDSFNLLSLKLRVNLSGASKNVCSKFQMQIYQL